MFILNAYYENAYGRCVKKLEKINVILIMLNENVFIKMKLVFFMQYDCGIFSCRGKDLVFMRV